MQQLRQYCDSEPSSSREPRVPRIPDRWLRQGEVENSEFSEISETSENIFRGFPLRVFHFAPAYTQNGKLGVGKPQNLINVPQRKLQGFQLRVFRFDYSVK